jgi:hypothetical protein
MARLEGTGKPQGYNTQSESDCGNFLPHGFFAFAGGSAIVTVDASAKTR